jgi:uncharacterized SAM-binding protein YcdF (DUF218 family)
MLDAAASDVTAVSEYIFIPDDLFSADIAIVFGMTLWRHPVALAVRLHNEGMAKKLLFTGGFSPRLQAVEGWEMANAAMQAGIPRKDVFIEEQATNTAENVSNAYRCIQQSIGIENIKAILLVAIHFHIRRVKMTVQRVFPEAIKIGTASYPSVSYSATNWHLSQKGRSDVLSELRKIKLYLGEDISRFEAIVRRIAYE